MPQIPPRRFSPNVKGKIIQANYDYVFAAEGEFAPCLTMQQITWILSIIDQAGWATRWYSEIDTAIDTDKIQALQGDLARRLMAELKDCEDDTMYLLRQNPSNPCQLQQSINGGETWTLAFDYALCLRAGDENPPLERYEETYSGHETSYDGGETWVSTPDSRFKSPMTNNIHKDEIDAACITSFQMIEYLKPFVELDDEAALLAVVSFFVDLFAYVLGYGAVVPVVTTLVMGMIETGIANIKAAMAVPGEWEKLQENIYCHAEPDGSISLPAYYQILDQVSVDHVGAAKDFLFNLLVNLGWIGLNNAGHFTAPGTPDCSEFNCAGWCYVFDFTTGQLGWVINTDPEVFGRYTSGVGFQQNVDYDPADAIEIASPAFMAIVTRIVINYDPALGGSFPRTAVFLGQYGEDIGTDNFGGSSKEFLYPEGQVITDGISFDVDPYNGGQEFSDVTIISVQIEGTGTNPFGEDNCE